MLGYEPHEVIGRPFWQMILSPDYHDAEREIRAGIARGESAQTFEAVFVCKDGKHLDVSATASPLRDANRNPAGVSVIARDITDRRATEAALRERDAAEEASRLKSEFLATMSHELRTPLNGIIGFAEYLRAGHAGPLGAEQGECIESVHDSSMHLLQLINSILDLSIIESGKMEVRQETFSVPEAVAEACAELSAMAEKKHIQLQQRVAPALSSVTLDRAKFVQVLYHLASNGVKFTNPGGRVDIEVDVTHNRHLCIRVSDTGIGIATEDIDKLFRIFHQLDGGDARRQEGAGLGLALTKKIVELLHGSIAVESAPGKGSVFTVTLPY
jgi:PAS domain S-box-containing protein